VEESLGPGDKDSDMQKMYELAMVKKVDLNSDNIIANEDI
jgi:hypothetical protein